MSVTLVTLFRHTSHISFYCRRITDRKNLYRWRVTTV